MEKQPANAVASMAIRHAAVILLSIIYLFGVGRFAAYTPLGFDEIFTHTIARFDGPVTIIQALLEKADNHPPLDYLIRHASMQLLGNSEFALRLPSLIAVLSGALCLYVFILRRGSRLPALIAFAFLLSTMALRFASIGRGYALMLASMCFSLLAWQLATEKATKLRVALLLISLSIGPFSHFYGVLNYAPIMAGEAWRSWRRKKVSWPIVIAVVGSLASLSILLPFIVNASNFSGTFWTTYGFATPFGYYRVLLGWSILSLVAGLAACALLLALRPAPTVAGPAHQGLQDHEAVAAVTLCSVPFITFAMAELITHALTERYTLITLIGLALVIAVLISQAERRRRDVALVFTICTGLWTAAVLANQGFSVSENARTDSVNNLASIDAAGAPVVISNSHDFLVTQFYLPAGLRRNVFYLSDSASALKYMGFDTDERAFANLGRFASLNIAEFCKFIRNHNRFILIGGDPNWLIPRLLDDGAVLTVRPAKKIKRAVYDVQYGRNGSCR